MPLEVIIHVLNGTAHIVSVPQGVTVTIKDYDDGHPSVATQERQETFQDVYERDENGLHSRETINGPYQE